MDYYLKGLIFLDEVEDSGRQGGLPSDYLVSSRPLLQGEMVVCTSSPTVKSLPHMVALGTGAASAPAASGTYGLGLEEQVVFSGWSLGLGLQGPGLGILPISSVSLGHA